MQIFSIHSIYNKSQCVLFFANVIPTCNINVTHHPPNRREGRLPHDARRVDRDTAKVRTLASNSDAISFVSYDRRARVYSKCRHPFCLTTDNFVGGISYTEHMPRIDQTGPMLGCRWGDLIIKIFKPNVASFFVVLFFKFLIWIRHTVHVHY